MHLRARVQGRSNRLDLPSGLRGIRQARRLLHPTGKRPRWRDARLLCSGLHLVLCAGGSRRMLHRPIAPSSTCSTASTSRAAVSSAASAASTATVFARDVPCVPAAVSTKPGAIAAAVADLADQRPHVLRPATQKQAVRGQRRWGECFFRLTGGGDAVLRLGFGGHVWMHHAMGILWQRRLLPESLLRHTGGR